MAWGRASYYGSGTGNPGEDPGVSKYNSAQLINERMHELWLECKRNYKNGHYKELNGVLDVVYTELYADTTPDQKEQIKTFDLNIAKYENELNKRHKTFSEKKLWESRYVIEIKQKWLFLKFLEKKQGIGKAYRDEFEDDFD